MTRRRPSVWMVIVALLIGTSSVAANDRGVESPVSSIEAAAGDDVRCNCAPRAELEELADEIRMAPDLVAARDVALGSTAGAESALYRARWIVPGDHPDLDRAYAELERYRARVEGESAPEGVAAVFEDTFIERAPATAGASGFADIDIDIDDGGCSYTGGEIIATVLGFVLGIIPGVILLVLLC